MKGFRESIFGIQWAHTLTSMKQYNPKSIEKKWQKTWQTKKTYGTSNSSSKKKYYVLDMFPYPSGAGLHVGHPRGYIGSDVYARMMRMQGFNVLHPMGYDAFGLPAEQYAITHKVHPREAVKRNVATFERQLSVIGLSYDWSRKVNTTDPEYYCWTQWIFLKLYNSWYDNTKNKARSIEDLVAYFNKKGNEGLNAVCDDATSNVSKTQWLGMDELAQAALLMKYRLAYEGYSEVNWSPSLGTVLANDEVNPDGTAERDGKPVEKKLMRQWFMRITAYADRLINGLAELDWSDAIKETQKNWIGRSDGSLVPFSLHTGQHARDLFVLTTRPAPLFGVTYVVIAPEHEILKDLKKDIKNWSEVEAYIKETKKVNDMDRTNVNREKTGIELKGITAINPANGIEVPVWIADYVLAQYGTGIVMAVPAHDERDMAFADKYQLPIKKVIISENPIDDGILTNSKSFDGMLSGDAKIKITEAVDGRRVIKYKLRDAVFARQRYWGEPIPLMHTKDGMLQQVKEKELPLTLPNVKTYEPTGTGESPLASVSTWMKKGYETNTMPGWAGSSWYFLRYMDPQNAKAFAGEKALKYWKNVDMYVGGSEHATGHLLYARFWHKFLHDMGYVPTDEPFKALRNQGMILASDGRKMSKRWGNVINPDEVVETYGADTLRLYEMFMGPFESTLPWSTDSIIGCRRFLERVWRLQEKVVAKGKTSDDAQRALHKCIKKVTDDIKTFGFNTAVSAMMICEKSLTDAEVLTVDDFKKFLQVLAPFAPHMAEELWTVLGEKKSIHVAGWPKFNAEKIKEDTITMAVQINGKVRGTITIAVDANQEQVQKAALEHVDIVRWLATMEVKKVIYVPGKIINIVAV